MTSSSALRAAHRVYRHQLSNGLRVIASPNPLAPDAAVCVRYGVGFADEIKGRSGVAYVLQRLMVDHAGSAARARGCALATRGGFCEATTDTHATFYVNQISADLVELALWVEADRMAGPPTAITQTSLDRLRILIAQEEQQDPPSVLTRAEQRLRAELFPGNHRYRHHLLAAMTCLHVVAPADVQAFFETFYSPSNAVLAVTGGVDPLQVLDRVERYFAAIPDRARRPTLVPRLGPLDGPVYASINAPPARLAPVQMAFRLPGNSSRDGRDLLAAEVALRVLAGIPASRLHQRLVHNQRIIERIGIRIDAYPATSIGRVRMAALAGTPTGVIDGIVHEALDSLAAAGPRQGELAQALEATERHMVNDLATIRTRAVHLADSTARLDSATAVYRVSKDLRAIDAREVHETARRWLTARHRLTVATHYPTRNGPAIGAVPHHVQTRRPTG